MKTIFSIMIVRIALKLMSLVKPQVVQDEFQKFFDVDISEREYSYQPSALESVMTRLGYFPREISMREIERRFQVKIQADSSISKYDEKVPSILIATMPKSGSSFISLSLMKNLPIDRMGLDEGPFPQSHIRVRNLLELEYGNRLGSDHFAATDINIEYLRKTKLRVFVHSRDPRDALVSWIHYLNKYHQFENEYDTNYNLFKIYPSLPAGYFDLTFQEQMDYQIGNFYHDCISWIDSWLLAKEKLGEGRVCFGSMEEMIKNPTAYLRRISEFFEVPEYLIETLEMIDKDNHPNFRKGESGEWREALTDQQIRRVNSMLPQEQSELFGWPNERSGEETNREV